MKITTIKNRAVIKWFGDELLKEIGSVKEKDESDAAERIYRDVLRFTPVGSHRRSYRRKYINAMGKEVPMKGWQQRLPGRLRSTISKFKSKFDKGGWVVWGGSWLAYYARIVEYGTKARRQKTTGRFTGKAKASRYMRKALSREKSRFINAIKKSLSQLRGMND